MSVQPLTPSGAPAAGSQPSTQLGSVMPYLPPAKTPARRAFRRWLMAMAAAAVTSLVLILLFEGSRGWPGLVFDEPGRGLYGLSAIVYTGPDWLLHASVFAAITLVFVMLLAAAMALDRDGFAAHSLHWACRPRAIRVLVCVPLVFLIADVLLPREISEVLAVAMGIPAALLLVVAPFLSGNPATLARSTLSSWWQPWWPGGRVLLWILPLSLLTWHVVDWALCRADPLGIAGGIAGGILGCLSSMSIELLAALAIAALWFGYRRRQSFLSTMRALLRRRMLRAFIAYQLYVACIGLAVALPLMVLAAYHVYALPQFTVVSQQGGAVLSLAQEMLLSFRPPSNGWDSVVILLMAFAALPLSFANDRLLFVHGLGAHLGPQSPSAGGAGGNMESG